jgi:putative tributyrin esterase
MTLINCNFYSYALGHRANMSVLLPQPAVENWWQTRHKPAGNFPVLYLFHGLCDDDTQWTRFTSLERYLEFYNLAVVMPSIHCSMYVDIGNIPRYWTFISEELPAFARSYFPISERREDTFVAGMSMGGYGAFKLGLSYPDRFAAAASLSGRMDIDRLAEDPSRLEHLQYNYGEHPSLAGGRHDLFYLVKEAARADGPKPRLYMCCGTEDYLYQGNQDFKELVESLGLNLTYEEGPGIHDYSYIDPMVPRMLAWLPLSPTDKAVQNI